MNTTYTALKWAGLWDLAAEHAESAHERAEILTDRFWWTLRGAGEAEAAVAGLGSGGAFLDAQLAYTRVVFGLGTRPGDRERARSGFTRALADTPWAEFWLGVVAEHLDHDAGAAAGQFARALDAARETRDPLLESYAIRHLGGQAVEEGDREAGIGMLRRSYHLRAALGARPQTAAAAATLAAALPPGGEADDLRRTAAATARELGLTWLLEE